MTIKLVFDRQVNSLYARNRRSKYKVGFLFILPALIMYAVFVLYPFIRTFQISLTDWNGFDPVMRFIGLDNYIKLLGEPQFWAALAHNIYWIIVGSIGAIGIGLILALLVSTRPVGFHVFRTVYFMPQVLVQLSSE